MCVLFSNRTLQILLHVSVKLILFLTFMQAAKLHSPIHYPKADGVLSFDVPTSLHRYLNINPLILLTIKNLM